MPVTLRLLTPLLFLFANSLAAAPPSKLEIKKGDHVCFIGNSLAVRLSQPGHTQFESLIYQRFPKHDIVIRNLAWPADEVALRPRTDGFGTPDENLAAVKADVIIAFFGFNESFKGEAGLEQFKADLNAWIVHTKQQNYSGKGAPRIALIGPVRPSGYNNAEDVAHNVWLYSETMKFVAAKHSVLFADLFGGPMLVFSSPQSDAVVRHDGLAATLTRPPEMVILRNNNNNRVHFTTTPGGDSMSEALVSSQAWNISSHALALRLEKLLFEPTRPDWASERFWQAGEVRLSMQTDPGSQAVKNQPLGSIAQYYNTHPGISLVSPIEGHQEHIGLAGNSNGWRLLSRPGTTSDSSPRQVELTNGKDIVKYRMPLPVPIQTLIAQRDQLWQQRYRIVDSYYTYGGRSDLKFADGAQTNRDVMQREREVLDVMIANRDKRIWDLVRREVVEERNDWGTSPYTDGLTAKERTEAQLLWTKIDDSNVPHFLPVKTFFGTGKKTDAGQNTGMTSKTAEPDAIKFLTPEEEKKTFTLAKGYEANCFASERDFPDLGNAVAMAFDVRGRLWVSTFQSYPQWQPGEPMNDKILILEDRDHDGKADVQIVFAQNLHMPISFQFYDGGILVSHQRELLLLKDTNGDDIADLRAQVLDGFDSADSHHVINSFTFGPGGDLWFQEGTFQHSQVETPYGPVRCVDAGTYRYEPKNGRLEVAISYKYANPHGIAFDRWGQLFISDASGGANYWGTALSSWLPYPEKHSTMQQWFPKRVRPTSGCEFVSSRHFPDEAQGRFLLNNCIGVQGILQHEVKEVGSGFEGKEIEPLLLSSDPLFRPVAMSFAPDGTLFVIDWAEALIGHMQYSIRDPLRDKMHGRIWRITYPSRPLVNEVKIERQDEKWLLEQLCKVPEHRVKERIKQELSVRLWKDIEKAFPLALDALDKELETTVANEARGLSSKQAVAVLSQCVENAPLEMLWLHQWQQQINEDLLHEVLTCSNPNARAAAVKVLCAWRESIPNVHELLLAAAKDEHPRVRLEAVRAVSWLAESKVRLGAMRDSESSHRLKPVIPAAGQATPSSISTKKGESSAASLSTTSPSDHGLKPMTTLTPAAIALAVLDKTMDYYLDYTLNETMRVIDVDVKSLKNPKALAFVVNRLTNDELAAAADIEPIFAARLARKGFDPVKREAALTALMELRKQDRVTVITDAINKLDTQGATAQAAVIELGRILLASGPALKPQRPLLYTMSRNAISQSFTREIAYAAVALADGSPEQIWQATDDDVATRTMLLNAIPLIPDAALRATFGPKLSTLFAMDKIHHNIRIAALKALPALANTNASASFKIAASHLQHPPSFEVAVSVLSQLPKTAWDQAAVPALAKLLLAHCTETPADQRTDEAFIEAQQLGIDLASLMPDGEALKKKLRALGVATVLIKTLREQMIYDKLTFEVEAGKPVAIILENTDIMPHNLVIVQPGSADDIVAKALTMPPVPDKAGRLYVPDSDQVLAATKMLEPGQREKLTWTAPKQPGKVPFLCTFPGHAVRMKGEIVVRGK